MAVFHNLHLRIHCNIIGPAHSCGCMVYGPSTTAAV